MRIAIVVLIILGFLLLGGGAYFGLTQYQADLKNKEQIRQQAETQQKELQQAQSEIERLKQEASPNKPIVIEETKKEVKTEPESTKQILSTPPACNTDWKCGEWTACAGSLQTRNCVDANSCGVLTNKPSVAQSCVIVCNPNWQCSGWSICANSIQTRNCNDLNGCNNKNGEPLLSQACVMSETKTVAQVQATPTGKNYYYDIVSKVRQLLATHNSFKTWLQDTSNQLRQASVTLAGYPTGGLYGQMRDAAIDLASGEISVLSGLIESTNQWISRYEGSLDILNKNPDLFVDKATYDAVQEPSVLESDVSSVKNSINNDVSKVMGALQYH